MKSESPPATAGPARSPKPSHDQIAEIAYRLYLESGAGDGHDLDHWFRAEQSLLKQTQGDAPSGEALSRNEWEIHTSKLEQPFARDTRGSANREEIRQQASTGRPAPRESLRPVERSNQPR